MSEWKQVGENLVRHKAGTIYLSAKVRGKKIRKSLKTSDLRTAKRRRDERLTTLRAAAAAVEDGATGIRTIADAIDAVADRVLSQPHLEETTLKYYRSIFRVLRETLPIAYHARTWTRQEAVLWWKRIATQYAATRANNTLSMAKRMGTIMKESGIRADDPTEELKRMKIVEKEFNVASTDEVYAIGESVRSMKKAHSEESADFIEFLAFAGCRHGQAKGLYWHHIEQDWVIFPGGVEGTKGAKKRELPISRHLRKVLERMEKRNPKREGKLFKIGTPRDALNNATERLGIPHLRIHDLRHTFATYAIEQGVDIPTIARWLGHKDGGALLMRTYSHTRAAHSLESANKL